MKQVANILVLLNSIFFLITLGYIMTGSQKQATPWIPHHVRDDSFALDPCDRWDSLIKYHAAKQGVSRHLIKAIAFEESSFDPYAISPCGAKGLMQLMPATAKEVGLAEELMFDPEENLKAGIRYWKIQYEHFPEISNPEEKILFSCAAYNAGRGNINRAITLCRDAGQFWQNWQEVAVFLPKVTGHYAQETIDYVARIRALYDRAVEKEKRNTKVIVDFMTMLKLKEAIFEE